MSEPKVIFASSDSSDEDIGCCEPGQHEHPKLIKITFASSDSSDVDEDEIVINKNADFSHLPLASVECNNDPELLEFDPGEGQSRHRMCCKSCNKSCGFVVDSLEEDEKKRILTLFSGSKLEFKRKLINHLQTQRNIGLSTNVLCIIGKQLCPSAFSSLVNRSEYLVKKAEIYIIKSSHALIRYFTLFNVILIDLLEYQGALCPPFQLLQRTVGVPVSVIGP